MTNDITHCYRIMTTIINCCVDLTINVLSAEIKESGVSLRAALIVDTMVLNEVRILIFKQLSDPLINISLSD